MKKNDKSKQAFLNYTGYFENTILIHLVDMKIKLRLYNMRPHRSSGEITSMNVNVKKEIKQLYYDRDKINKLNIFVGTSAIRLSVFNWI